MGQNETIPTTLSARQETAARLIAEDEVSDEKIADAVGVARSTLSRWRQEPAFRQRVTEHIATIREQVLSSGWARVDKRIGLLAKNINRVERIIGENENHPDVIDRPGASTGLIFREVTPGRFGDVVTYKVATNLLAEQRAALRDLAQQAGQLTEKLDVNFDPTALSDEELEAIARRKGAGRARAEAAGGTEEVPEGEVVSATPPDE